VADYARRQPAAATESGISGHDHDLPGYPPDGHRARAELARRALAALCSARAAGESEPIAETVFAEPTGLKAELHEAGLPMAARTPAHRRPRSSGRQPARSARTGPTSVPGTRSRPR
jgi:hypothetical protein